MHDSAQAQYGSRRCHSAWLPLNAVPAARKLRGAVKAAQDAFEVLPRAKNGAHRCVYEDVQYSEYSGALGGHFQQWHVDADDDGDDEEDGRALTIVALLAEPGVDFRGGDFQCVVSSPSGGGGDDNADEVDDDDLAGATAAGSTSKTVAWRKGDAIAFRAKQLWHRVLPTTEGMRKTLVLWAKDPAHKPAVVEGAEDDGKSAAELSPPAVGAAESPPRRDVGDEPSSTLLATTAFWPPPPPSLGDDDDDEAEQ
mmetsp:Transcript_25770/g.102900  ORF Transcript_25770/g.102900 Transcript_25770/m.102900 type:complete len:253 (+) Transcript_25770:459-1217(+)